MKRHAFVFCVVGLVAGCATSPAPVADTAPQPVPPIATVPPAPPPVKVSLEQRHRHRAQAYEAERNWADALVQWELLTLLKPEVKDYRDAAEAARKRIRTAIEPHLKAADAARRAGNPDQATLLYLRALNLDRENAAAAQALREIDVERNQRAYLNRLPRGSYNNNNK